MSDLLKILPLMKMPEAIRQPMLLGAIAGKDNAMVGFVTTQRAVDAATGVVAEKDAAIAANAATLARLATFHAAMMKDIPTANAGGLEKFDTFKAELLKDDASAKALGEKFNKDLLRGGKAKTATVAEDVR